MHSSSRRVDSRGRSTPPPQDRPGARIPTPPRPVHLVLFDIFDTLLRPVQPPHLQYLDEARRLGLVVPPRRAATPSPTSTGEPRGARGEAREDAQVVITAEEWVRRSFSEAFRTWSRRHPNYGHARVDDQGLLGQEHRASGAQQGEPPSTLASALGPDRWWGGVIAQTFGPCLDETAEWQGRDAAASTRRRLQARLLQRFGSADAYVLFDDVEPALEELARMATAEPSGGSHVRDSPRGARADDPSSPGGGTKSVPRSDETRTPVTSSPLPPLRMGLASNSDARILIAVRGLGLERFGLGASLHADHDDGQLVGDGNPGSSSREKIVRTPALCPPTLSYELGYAKPSSAFFHHAVLRAQNPWPRSLPPHSQGRRDAAGASDPSGAQPRRSPSTSSSSSSSSALRHACAHTLYVGDSRREDHDAARRAGLQALWLDRRPGGGHDGQGGVGASERDSPRTSGSRGPATTTTTTETSDGPDDDGRGAWRVGSLADVVEYVRRSRATW